MPPIVHGSWTASCRQATLTAATNSEEPSPLTKTKTPSIATLIPSTRWPRDNFGYAVVIWRQYPRRRTQLRCGVPAHSLQFGVGILVPVARRTGSGGAGACTN